MAEFLVNCRTLGAPGSGVQRYLRSLLAAMGEGLERAAPRAHAPGLRGHAWEQCVLPGLLRGRRLWSPGNTGPIAVRDQVVTVHDAAVLDHPAWFRPGFAAWYGVLVRALLERCLRVITVSEFSRERLARHAPRAIPRIRVVPNGVDALFSPAGPAEIERVRRAFTLDQPYLLYTGNLEPRKNLGTLLAAWRGAAQWPGILVLAGAPLDVCRASVRMPVPPSVRLLGRVEDADLPALMSGAAAFVYPSLYEGFGLPVLEALACGSPVLCSDIPALREVAGDAACYIPAPDVVAWRDAMREALARPEWGRARVAAGLRIAARFSWQQSAALTWRALRE